MFEIDLLKGKNRPQKTDLKRVVLGLVLLLVPIGATMVYAVGVQHDRIQLGTLTRAIENNQARLEDYQDAVAELAALRRRISRASQPVDEIAKALHYRQIASELFVELAERLPSDIVLNDMNLRRNLIRERKMNRDTGRMTVDTVVQRSLRLTLHGDGSSNSDAAVQDYINALKHSPVLAPLVSDIRPAAREQRDVRNKTVTQYQIDVLLKDQR